MRLNIDNAPSRRYRIPTSTPRSERGIEYLDRMDEWLSTNQRWMTKLETMVESAPMSVTRARETILQYEDSTADLANAVAGFQSNSEETDRDPVASGGGSR